MHTVQEPGSVPIKVGTALGLTDGTMGGIKDRIAVGAAGPGGSMQRQHGALVPSEGSTEGKAVISAVQGEGDP